MDDALVVFDESLRKAPLLHAADQRVEVEGGIVRVVGDGTAHWDNVVERAELSERDADAAIAAEIERFAARGRAFEWVVLDGDRPADLGERLRRAGFASRVRSTLMAFDLRRTPSAPLGVPDVEVIRIRDPLALDGLVRVQNEVWGGDHQDLAAQLGWTLRAAPERIALFAARVDGIEICHGWADLSSDGAAAMFWGGATAPAFRGRGAYSAVAAARMRAMAGRGARYAFVGAMESSRPILERLGFQPLTGMASYVWSPP